MRALGQIPTQAELQAIIDEVDADGNLNLPLRSLLSLSLSLHFISEREREFTFAICYRPSVCLSSVCLSVTFVCALLRRLKFSAIFLRH